MAKKRSKKAPARKKRAAKKPVRTVKAEIVPAARVDVVPTNPGDDMAPALELAGRIARDQLEKLRKTQVDAELSPAELGHFNALAQSLTRVERSLRQWRELKKREAAELSEDELRVLIPKALVALGVPEDLVRQVVGAIGGST